MTADYFHKGAHWKYVKIGWSHIVRKDPILQEKCLILFNHGRWIAWWVKIRIEALQFKKFQGSKNSNLSKIWLLCLVIMTKVSWSSLHFWNWEVFSYNTSRLFLGLRQRVPCCSSFKKWAIFWAQNFIQKGRVNS